MDFWSTIPEQFWSHRNFISNLQTRTANRLIFTKENEPLADVNKLVIDNDKAS